MSAAVSEIEEYSDHPAIPDLPPKKRSPEDIAKELPRALCISIDPHIVMSPEENVDFCRPVQHEDVPALYVAVFKHGVNSEDQNHKELGTHGMIIGVGLTWYTVVDRLSYFLERGKGPLLELAWIEALRAREARGWSETAVQGRDTFIQNGIQCYWTRALEFKYMTHDQNIWSGKDMGSASIAELQRVYDRGQKLIPLGLRRFACKRPHGDGPAAETVRNRIDGLNSSAARKAVKKFDEHPLAPLIFKAFAYGVDHTPYEPMIVPKD